MAEISGDSPWRIRKAESGGSISPPTIEDLALALSTAKHPGVQIDLSQLLGGQRITARFAGRQKKSPQQSWGRRLDSRRSFDRDQQGSADAELAVTTLIVVSLRDQTNHRAQSTRANPADFAQDTVPSFRYHNTQTKFLTFIRSVPS